MLLKTKTQSLKSEQDAYIISFYPCWIRCVFHMRMLLKNKTQRLKSEQDADIISFYPCWIRCVFHM